MAYESGMDYRILIAGAAAAALFLFIRASSFAKPDAARALLAQGGKLIDVRTSGEYAGGHVAKAVNVPLDQLGARIAQVAPDKASPLLLYCASGARSGAGVRILKGMGYTNVANLGGHGRAQHIAGNP